MGCIPRRTLCSKVRVAVFSAGVHYVYVLRSFIRYRGFLLLDFFVVFFFLFFFKIKLNKRGAKRGKKKWGKKKKGD